MVRITVTGRSPIETQQPPWRGHRGCVLFQAAAQTGISVPRPVVWIPAMTYFRGGSHYHRRQSFHGRVRDGNGWYRQTMFTGNTDACVGRKHLGKC
jgi:hypothetical protein